MYFSISYLSDIFNQRGVQVYEHSTSEIYANRYYLKKNDYIIGFDCINNDPLLFRELVFKAYYRLILTEFIQGEFMTLPLDEEHGNGD